MGDGSKLQQILYKKNCNIRKLAAITGISPTTLYSIVQRDSGITIEIAVPIAEVLNIDFTDICACDSRTMTYLKDYFTKYSLSESEEHLNTNDFESILKRFKTEDLEMLKELLRSFYWLDDRARADVIDIIRVMFAAHRIRIGGHDLKEEKSTC